MIHRISKYWYIGQNKIMQIILPSFLWFFSIYFPICFSPIRLQINIISKRIKLAVAANLYVANLKVLLMVFYSLYSSFNKTVKMPSEASCIIYASSGSFHMSFETHFVPLIIEVSTVDTSTAATATDTRITWVVWVLKQMSSKTCTTGTFWLNSFKL